MATPQAAVALVAQIFCTTLTFYIPNIRCILWVLSALPALAGAIMIHGMHLIPSGILRVTSRGTLYSNTKTVLKIASARTASLAGVYLMGFYNVSWVLMLSLQSSNTAGMTKKSFVSVSIAIFYGIAFHSIPFPASLLPKTCEPELTFRECNAAVGNIVGPQFFLTSQSPKYSLGIGAMLCCFAIMAATGILYGVLVFAENRRRDRVFGIPERDRVAVGLAIEDSDQTDGQNKEFRYVY